MKASLAFRFSFEPSFPKLTSLSFSLRPSVLRHVMYTIVDGYDNERETWSKSNDLTASATEAPTKFRRRAFAVLLVFSGSCIPLSQFHCTPIELIYSK
jgi:hypothetical protein